ncbi:MAG TPA: hypothetical protein VIT38_02415 [Allosphingosinicella sp.]|jgi:hypothetical protein
MSTGRLAISRGYQLLAYEEELATPQLSLVQWFEAPAEAEAEPESEAESEIESALPLPPVSPELQIVHDRLTALERLTHLFEQGVLSVDEFVDEKARILGRQVDELILCNAAPVSFSPAEPRPVQLGPSLVGRMMNWKFLLISLVVGLAFSLATLPDATLHLFVQVARYFTA